MSRTDNEQAKSISRRQFLRLSALTGMGTVLAACGQDGAHASQRAQAEKLAARDRLRLLIVGTRHGVAP
ncbi:MAG: twin-arginine translocation signal domain-containing protein [Chloroflexales bacterium]